MGKLLDAAEVAQHNTPESCWVILYGKVYNVTSFLPNHPGGSKIILSLAGKDGTEDYDPVHPPGTLEDNLPESACIGEVDPDTLPKPEAEKPENAQNTMPSDAPKSATKPESHPEDLWPISSLLNLDEIEARGTRKMSKKGWAYYYSAADDLFSKHYNNKVYRKILLRPRVFVNCLDCDLTTTFLGYPLGVPIFIAPAAMARLAHPDGEHGMAKAAARFNAMQMISNNASMTPEQIVKDALSTQVFGWQLYVQTEIKKSEDMLRRINALDAIKFICLTLDAPVPGKREDDERSKNIASDLPNSSALVKAAGGQEIAGGGGIGQSLFAGTDPTLTWDKTLPWLASKTSKPIILKGLQTHEDAYLAYKHPLVKGVILSNHGGRAADTAPPALHTLLEIRRYCPEILRQPDFEILVDGGIKRGTDVVKALALGAKAVGIGRAALFGLAAGGQEGVERTFEILRDETATATRLLGVQEMKQLGERHVNTAAVERDLYNGPPGEELEGSRGVKGLWAKSKL
ncbi:putative mitochondrial cytochrome b2 [Phaeomoniella chlamydospora]|uniref:L-lactate dehydrogenase (cytochrome) n=1 Tax=Phaeomoniella chlamydospora TaxID=158046 RepID=A0A0G2GNC8_PHACM|nr:putative mitochondrial cytochrome b2 [Phaeomoniella chlamydospora]